MNSLIRIGLFALFVLSTPLTAFAAKWVKVGPAPGGEAYIDSMSQVKADKGIKLWSLSSYGAAQSSPDGKPYRSVKALHLYSCEDRTSTLLNQVFYTDTMGQRHAAAELQNN